MFNSRRERRQARALAISANIMIADAKLNIIYMNPATQDLLKSAEEDLSCLARGGDFDRVRHRYLPQKAFPSAWDAGALKNRHQSDNPGWTACLRSRSDAHIKQGEKVFAFVVEWSDARARIQNTDYQDPASRNQPRSGRDRIQPFRRSRHGNDSFLAATGYALSDIKGRSHRMFLDEGADGDRLFETLWTDLRGNKPYIGDIVRYGKGGKADLFERVLQSDYR